MLFHLSHLLAFLFLYQMGFFVRNRNQIWLSGKKNKLRMIMKEYWCLSVIKGQGKKQDMPKTSPAWIHETSSRAVNNDSTPKAFSPWTFPHDSNAQIRKYGWVTLPTVSSLFSWGVCQERKERAGLELSRHSSQKRGMMSSKH